MASGRLRSLILASLIAACGAPPLVVAPDGGADDAATTTSDGGRDGSTALPPDASTPLGPDGGETPDGGEPPDAGLPDDAGFVDDDAGVITRDGGSVPPPPADAGAGRCFQPSGVGPAFTLRTVAANLTSGNCQSWDPGEGLRILQGLKADVVLIQEFNYYSSHPAFGCPPTDLAEVPEFVEALYPGEGYVWSRGLSGKIPNGIISRYPIIAWGDWNDTYTSDREFTWALIDLPGPRDLWAVSVHLLTSSASDRSREAAQLVTYLNANVPAGDFVLVGGDFNTDKTSEGAFSTLGAKWMVVGAPVPVDQRNNSGTNANRDKPYDQLLASKCLNPLKIPVTIGAQSFDAGLVFDSRVYTPLSDVSPVQAGDSNGFQMQHMAVVKDFLIQP